MPQESDPIDALERQLTALADTHSNLAGLIQKTSRIQAELSEASLESFADQVGGIFASLSRAAEELQEVLHSVEIERNRLRSEG